MMDYNEENSYNEAHTSNQKGTVREEGEGETEDYSQEDSVKESQIKNYGSSDNMDPLTEAFDSFQTLQEALERELHKFQELGKGLISLPQDGAENSSCIHAGHERASEASSFRRFGSENLGESRLTSVDSEILNLVNNVKYLEIKLAETKFILEVKESQIRELKSRFQSISEPCDRSTVLGMEDIFQQKMEAEIEYLIFSGSVKNLKRQIKLIGEEKTLAENEAHKMLSMLGEAESKAHNLENQAKGLQNHCVEITDIQEANSLKKSVFKTRSCLLLQLGLLFILFSLQFMPESVNVVPT